MNQKTLFFSIQIYNFSWHIIIVYTSFPFNKWKFLFVTHTDTLAIHTLRWEKYDFKDKLHVVLHAISWQIITKTYYHHALSLFHLDDQDSNNDLLDNYFNRIVFWNFLVVSDRSWYQLLHKRSNRGLREAKERTS